MGAAKIFEGEGQCVFSIISELRSRKHETGLFGACGFITIYLMHELRAIMIALIYGGDLGVTCSIASYVSALGPPASGAILGGCGTLGR